MSAGDRRKQAVTSHDVARAAGVSRASVSRAFAADGNISPKLRSHVLQVAQDIGYSVNQIARGLNRQRSDLVGIIASRLDNPHRSAQVEALTKGVVAQGLRPLLFCIERNEPVDRILGLLLDYQVSGVIITSGSPDETIVERCAAHEVPLILVDRPNTDWERVDHVTGDNVAGGRMVAQALQEKGRSHIVVVRPRRITHAMSERVDSLVTTCGEFDIAVETILMDGSDYDAALQCVSHWLTTQNAPVRDGSTALFVPNDISALGALDALRVTGLAVPQDIGLMGYDDIAQAAWVGASLSTVRQDPETIAAEVLTLLARRIETPDGPPTTIRIPVTLKLRSTH
ncbi:LacI family DNA-binding transcriptional regulator [Ahrensia marina]|uniref:LacI family DNA-binding transcriptional regulator n=1 Tax=Ahrensia marina TaxID=1514904 RepID=UPI0035D09D11